MMDTLCVPFIPTHGSTGSEDIAGPLNAWVLYGMHVLLSGALLPWGLRHGEFLSLLTPSQHSYPFLRGV